MVMALMAKKSQKRKGTVKPYAGSSILFVAPIAVLRTIKNGGFCCEVPPNPT